MPTLYVVIPHYNEGNTIEQCVRRVLDATLPDGWTVSVVLVDDRSNDADRRTAEALVERLTAEDRPVGLQLREVNGGKGAALRTGFDHVLATGPADDDLVVIQDADLEYDPADYRRLMEPVLRGEVDVVIGSRWGEHRPVAGVKGRLHAWGNGVLTWLSNAMTGYRLHDMESCHKLMTVRMLRRVRPFLTESRYGVEPQMVALFSSLGAAIVEVTISYEPRGFSEGKKIGWKDGVRALYVIVREKRRRLDRDPTLGRADR